MSTIKKNLASKLLKVTTNLAKTSTVASPIFIFSEPKLPKALLKK
jgi:cyclic lactone autoinducer peptide